MYLSVQFLPASWEILSYYYFEETLGSFLPLFSLWNTYGP